MALISKREGKSNSKEPDPRTHSSGGHEKRSNRPEKAFHTNRSNSSAQNPTRPKRDLDFEPENTDSTPPTQDQDVSRNPTRRRRPSFFGSLHHPQVESVPAKKKNSSQSPSYQASAASRRTGGTKAPPYKDLHHPITPLKPRPMRALVVEKRSA